MPENTIIIPIDLFGYSIGIDPRVSKYLIMPLFHNICTSFQIDTFRKKTSHLIPVISNFQYNSPSLSLKE
jgi:hypothetical protein